MIKSIATMVVLTLGAGAPVWAQEAPTEGSAVQSSMQQAARPSEAEKKTFEDELRRVMESSRAPVPKRDSDTSGRVGASTPMRAPRARPLPPESKPIDTEELNRAVGKITVQIMVRCWRSQAGMPEAKRLRATIGVRFNPNGSFLEPPKLLQPAETPADDAPMRLFIQRAMYALEKCSAEGLEIPPVYIDAGQPMIAFDFLPGLRE